MPKFHGGLIPPIPHHDPASIDCSTALLPYFYDFASPPPSPVSLFLSPPYSLIAFSSMFPDTFGVYRGIINTRELWILSCLSKIFFQLR